MEPPYTLGDLAARVDGDPGYVSRVLAALSDELLITRLPRGKVQHVEWEALVRQLASSYALLDANETTNWVASAGPEQFLHDLGTSKLKQWAITGSFAAARAVSVTAPEIAVVYADDPERVTDTLRLRQATTEFQAPTGRCSATSKRVAAGRSSSILPMSTNGQRSLPSHDGSNTHGAAARERPVAQSRPASVRPAISASL